MNVLLLAVPLAGCLLVLWLRHLAVGVVVTGITFAVSVVIAFSVDYARPGMQLETDLPWIPPLGLRFHLGVDGVSVPLIVLTSLLCFLSMIYLVRRVPERAHSFMSLLLLTEVGMLGTFVALDLLLFFVFFEVVLIPMYALIAGWGGASRGPAARQFILYTLLGSGVLLVGLLVIYGHTSTLNMVELAAQDGSGMSRAVQVIAFILVAGGLAVKVPMWPLHTWLPDAHSEAPTVGSVLLAGVLLKMGTYGLIRIAVPILPDGALAVAPFLGAFGVIGIVYAALACLAQRNLKRLIAFSSVGHMGFVLLGISTLTPAGINAALFANIAHGLITGLLFFLVGGMAERFGSTDMAQIGGGTLTLAPRLSVLLIIASVASFGLPGLAGFWGEMLAMLAAFDPAPGLNRGLYLVFMVVAGIGAVLTAAYFLVMLREVAQGTFAAWRRDQGILDVTRVEWAAWTPLVVLVFVVGIWPGLVLGPTAEAVGFYLGGL
ncbi:NADH-quinone oxidoreductase subunit M [Kibdelosporangium philippinense]|uniref:NADH-quinone oxidoreductase subunit M n=1 Tax=Kibdelosporangium philippinense TaxID=211113 RepID=A0ABS8Z5M2_9PSEU|nr:NADH-quinone oxidoreductase subunit M [Kibdelosporangium philippinense]MCE7002737.1 NADH-quinone oxidoreductase subunit M [Kibdelosporangium philippinense]